MPFLDRGKKENCFNDYDFPLIGGFLSLLLDVDFLTTATRPTDGSLQRAVIFYNGKGDTTGKALAGDGKWSEERIGRCFVRSSFLLFLFICFPFFSMPLSTSKALS